MNVPVHLPLSVVRFYGNLGYALDTIRARQITLINSSKLNDPFDPYLFFETDFEENYSSLIDYVSNNHPNEFARFIKVTPSDGWGRSVERVRGFFRTVRDRIYIFSTVGVDLKAHPEGNLYMWGHYASGHRGVAIEFDASELAGCFVTEHNKYNMENVNAELAWSQVEYRDNVSLITKEMFFDYVKSGYDSNPRRTLLRDYYDSIARTKSMIWQNENEWRLVLEKDDTRCGVHKMAIGENSIKSIYIGI